MFKNLSERIIKVEPKRLFIYVVVYFLWGTAMNAVGDYLEIARFNNWWQVLSCYILYMIPVSLLLRPYHFFTQYAYGLVAMGLLEFAGYALQTSYAYPDNILDKWFGIRNFSLGMTLFFAWYFPIGNWVVHRIYLLFIDKNIKK